MGIWQRLCGLRVEIEGYELTGHASDWRLTSVVRLFGGGNEGFGEDPNYAPAEQMAFQEAGPILPLNGQHTLGELSDLLETLAVSPATPAHPGSENYRRWAFESAALDLALRQPGGDQSGTISRAQRTTANVRVVVASGFVRQDATRS
jgi:hypothetical protein